MRKLQYTFKTDTLFKMLFVTHQDLLKKLVAALLGIPLESIGQFIVRNEEMPPEILGNKFCRLDINMLVNGQLVDLEVQIANEGDYPERVLYYWARDFSTSLPSGEGYSTLPRTIVISILDFRLFDCVEYHSFFQPLEVTRHTLLSDKMGFHFFELPKLPASAEDGDMLLLWLSLFKANTEEELEKIRAMEVPDMSQAINAYYRITASPEFRELERMREKARHDEAQALHHAEQKGLVAGRAEGRAEGISERSVEIAKNLLKMGMSLIQVSEATGLAPEELQAINQ